MERLLCPQPWLPLRTSYPSMKLSGEALEDSSVFWQAILLPRGMGNLWGWEHCRTCHRDERCLSLFVDGFISHSHCRKGVRGGKTDQQALGSRRGLSGDSVRTPVRVAGPEPGSAVHAALHWSLRSWDTAVSVCSLQPSPVSPGEWNWLYPWETPRSHGSVGTKTHRLLCGNLIQENGDLSSRAPPCTPQSSRKACWVPRSTGCPTVFWAQPQSRSLPRSGAHQTGRPALARLLPGHQLQGAACSGELMGRRCATQHLSTCSLMGC